VAADISRASRKVNMLRQCERSSPRSRLTDAEMKARQSSKIRQIGEALVAARFVSLDEQAKALALCRSTTWTILRANYKGSGLSATIINRMLVSPQLPPAVRAAILEYIDEKACGLYGHSKACRRKFIGRLWSGLH
jgi:hypothetical protein